MVDILLATYNGEKFLNAQISSIVCQSFQDWNLIVHDDGSVDSTIKILEEWMLKDSRIKIINDGIRCGGAAENFMHLLSYSTADYVMFCDQDDIWFDNKIQVMYNAICLMNGNDYKILYSNALVWMPEKGIKGNATISIAKNLREQLFFNGGIQGCSAIFSKEVRELMKRFHGKISMHDHLLNLIAVSFGRITFLDIPLMLYRNHGQNVTGETRTKICTKSNIFGNRSIPVIDRKHYETVKLFYSLYKKELSDTDKLLIKEYLLMPKLPLLYKLFKILKYRFKLYNSTMLLFLKILVRNYI